MAECGIVAAGFRGAIVESHSVDLGVNLASNLWA